MCLCNQSESKQFRVSGSSERPQWPSSKGTRPYWLSKGGKNLLSTAPKEADGYILPTAWWPKWKSQ
jgi:hypothetical protein